MSKTDTLLEQIGNLTLTESAELVKKMEDKFGISTAAPVMAAAPAAAAGPADEEDAAFNVVLKNFGEKKIEVIKVVREITGLGLKEAKTMVEKGNEVVKESLEKGEADEIKKKLEGAGAAVELKPA